MNLLALIFIIVICMMGLFAIAAFIIVKKTNVPVRETMDGKTLRVYKNGEDSK